MEAGTCREIMETIKISPFKKTNRKKINGSAGKRWLCNTEEGL